MLDAAAFASNQPQQSSPVNSDLELLMLKTTAQQSAPSSDRPMDELANLYLARQVERDDADVVRVRAGG
ncbi:hypothetical protein NDA17_005921 [Ustilago hordei]|nr:hypothetical protein NDA17_005921 [Ustilago hordei]